MVLPMHVMPFPLKPALQAHLYEPAVFVHTACLWQLVDPGLPLHSFISVSSLNKQSYTQNVSHHYKD